MLLTKEHYDLMARFEAEHSHRSLTREADKGTWAKGYVYQDGHVNDLFVAYRKGYSLGTVSGDAAEKLAAAPVAIMDTRDTLSLCAPTEEDFPGLYALQGRRVALVDMGPNEGLSSGRATSGDACERSSGQEAITGIGDASLLRALAEDVPDMAPSVRAHLRYIADMLGEGAYVGSTRCRRCGETADVSIRTAKPAPPLGAHASQAQPRPDDKDSEVKRLRAAAEKSERRAVEFGDLLHRHIIVMRAAVAAGKLESPAHGMQWILNTLMGPGHLPDLDEARALGGAQAMFDKEVADH